MIDELPVVGAVLGVAVAAAVGVPLPQGWTIALLVGALVVRRPVLVVVALALLVGARADASFSALEEPLPSRIDAEATLMSDPAPRRFGLQAVVSVDGRRYLAEVPTDAAGAVRPMLTGERIRIEGRPRDLDGAPVGWVRSRHLAGRLSATSIDEVGPGPPWYRVANALHRTITAGGATMGHDRGPLYTGLVLGDDREQSELMTFRFQAAGLTHLLAVSGQNVAFLLAVAAPLLRRVGPSAKVALALGVLVLFVLVTRAEPSVLRAAVMAAVAMAAVSSGRVTSGLRVLCLTVMAVLLADPLLVWSVGFQLSVCATAGLLVLARPLADRMPGPDWLRLPLAVTLAAQLTTAPLLLSLAGGLPSIAVLANLLAGPAAGAVMMLGVTVGPIAGLLREPWASWLQVPTSTMVAWVELVARWCSRAPAPTLGPLDLLVLVAASTWLLLVPRRIASTGWRRVSCVAPVVALVWTLWPAGPPAGTHRLDDGSLLRVSECGVVLELVAEWPDEVLEELWRMDVRRADLVVAVGGQRTSAAAQLIGEQLGARVERRDGAAPGEAAPGPRVACRR